MFRDKTKTPKRIFIVEDNAVYAKSLEQFLKAKFEGLETKIFPVGELCVDNLHMKPDYIIMDYYLDGQYDDAENGLTILKEIKAKDPKAKIIILSAQQDIEVALNVKDSGSMYVIKNPQAFDTIAELMQAKA